MEPVSMISLAAAALFVLGGPQDELSSQPDRYAQVNVQQRIIVRVPSRPVGAVPPRPMREWREGPGPSCVPANQIAGANIGDQSIDFILRDNRRVRARLNRRCDGLNYYRGFYLDRPGDGRICAERDVIRSRMGGQCDISEFRMLRPQAPPRRPRR